MIADVVKIFSYAQNYDTMSGLRDAIFFALNDIIPSIQETALKKILAAFLDKGIKVIVITVIRIRLRNNFIWGLQIFSYAVKNRFAVDF